MAEHEMKIRVMQTVSEGTKEIIPGSCPQHLTCLGILGDVSAVDAAVQRIKKEICK